MTNPAIPASGWSLSGLRTVTLAVALVFTFALAVGSSEARGEVRLVVTPASVQAPQKIRFAARAPRGTKRVVFYIDGRRRWVDRSASWQFGRTGYLPTTQMKSGRHRLAVKVKNRYGRVTGAARVVHIARRPAPSQDPLFDGAHLSDFDMLQEAPGAIQEVADPLGSGQTVFKMTVSDQDVAPITPSENPRAQALSPKLLNNGDEFWMRTKFLLPSDFPSSGISWIELMSVYGPPWNGSPPWGIGISAFSNPYRPFIGWQRNATHDWDIPWSMPLVRNRWVHVLLHERLATDGWVEMWIDGNPVTFFAPSGTPVSYNPDSHSPTAHLDTVTMDSSNNAGPNDARISNYRKLGTFNTVTVYFGPLLLGKTRESVGG
jgi:hypothetical protein